MKALIFGAHGQLGSELMRAAWPAGSVLVAHDLPDIDIASVGVVAKAIDSVHPDIVINAAAYTAVDKAESEPEKAFAVNATATRWMAEACAANNVPLIHVSTDYVFDGKKPTPYVENDPTAPSSVYGASKLKGEEELRAAWRRHFIFRTAWVYGNFGHNFVKTMLRLGQERGEVRVVVDQEGSPTAAIDIARTIVQLIPRAFDVSAPYGTYHLTNTGATSWHGLAQAVFAGLKARKGVEARAIPITTADYPTPARRPVFSILDCSLLQDRFGLSLRPWNTALDEVLDELLGPAS